MESSCVTKSEKSTQSETEGIDLTGTWSLNSNLSDDPSQALELQNVSWFIRKAIVNAPVTINIAQTLEPSSNIISITSSQSTLGRTVEDTRILDWDRELEQSHPLFGATTTRTRYSIARDIIGDGYLLEALSDNDFVVEVLVESIDDTWKSHQVWCFEIIEGVSRQTRRAVVSKNDQIVRIRMVYDRVE